MKVLVLNCGSSSVKYQLIETSLERIESNSDRVIARGAVERIGTSSAIHAYLRQICNQMHKHLKLRIQVSNFEAACRNIERADNVLTLGLSA